MLFNSLEFIFIFLPVSFFIFFYLNKLRLITAAKCWLVITNLFFYSWWNISYLPLLLLSTVFNYSITKIIRDYGVDENEQLKKKRVFQFGLVFNVGLLTYFKYMDFFIENTNALIGTDIPLLNLALPLAISFFTLQQIAFLIDSYEGLAEERKFLDYALFVTFFPQLIAGPIVHHKEMMPQFQNRDNSVVNFNNIALGLFIFSVGLFKKVVIADSLAPYVTAGFDVATTLNLIEAWVTSLSYVFQLYFDFSGYADMAIGTALLFNIQLPKNFNSPFQATDIVDFWQRWHMTLTRFIGAYIYNPILRSFKKLSFNKAMMATIIAFVIVGLWHGAAWTYVIFGAVHGLAMVVKHYWQKKAKISMNKFLAWLLTFGFINVTFVIFRAKEWDDAVKVLTSMFSLDNIVLPRFLASHLQFLEQYNIEFGGFLSNISGNITLICFLVISFVVTLFMKNLYEYKYQSNVESLVLCVFLFAVSILKISDYSEFLYFQF